MIATTAPAICHAVIFEIAAISDAAAAPRMPTPMPIAAIELAIAAPPPDSPTLPAATVWAPAASFASAADWRSPRNFFAVAAMPAPSLRHGDQNASRSDTCASTTLVIVASQSLPSRS